MTAALTNLGETILNDYLGAFGLRRISQPLVAERALLPLLKANKKPYGQYNVVVSPISETTRRTGRTTVLVKYVIEVGVVCRLADKQKADTDPGQQLLEELSLYHFDWANSADPIQWIENDVYHWGDQDLLASDGVFFGLWAATFEGTRQKRGRS